MDTDTKPVSNATNPAEPPPYDPNWTYPLPSAVQNAPAGYPQPGGYPLPQDAAYPPPAQGGSYPPPMNYPAYPPRQPTAQVAQPTTQIVMVSNACPSCRTGVLQDQFTTCGILLAIICFPIGMICCLVMKERVCTNCRATFS